MPGERRLGTLEARNECENEMNRLTVGAVYDSSYFLEASTHPESKRKTRGHRPRLQLPLRYRVALQLDHLNSSYG